MSPRRRSNEGTGGQGQDQAPGGHGPRRTTPSHGQGDGTRLDPPGARRQAPGEPTDSGHAGPAGSHAPAALTPGRGAPGFEGLTRPGDAARRRQAILQLLARAEEPIPGQRLAGLLGVTRAVIVHDVALLRAQGEPILATPAGYVLNRPPARFTWQVAVEHGPELQTIRRELYAMVDQGVTVRDVIVEHPVYGELRGLLDLRSRHDVDRFCRQMAATGAEPLLTLTGGPHLHTLEADDPTARARVEQALRELGFLLDKE
ncbi:putative small molecule binding protein (contains 3H domain) [Thermaerobacter subterraneus DSM 13965]|uniref:Small molecule binding protein (Contains 3H domain) n=1 Tax=Thermaerobacter subterraneus DSM 13965 TaxID=867903 RepID=K6Q2Y2_9FIRM|nr:putative small molecule binding protein (contains 3H domain) [Thermaerobacter subterraneus DSM 13965]